MRSAAIFFACLPTFDQITPLSRPTFQEGYFSLKNNFERVLLIGLQFWLRRKTNVLWFVPINCLIFFWGTVGRGTLEGQSEGDIWCINKKSADMPSCPPPPGYAATGGEGMCYNCRLLELFKPTKTRLNCLGFKCRNLVLLGLGL